WRQVIDHIVNINLTLAMSNLAFRGHRGIIGEGNIGNFLSIVELLAKYDPLLEELIRKPKGLTMYLSPKIQNKIIQLLSDQVTESIVNDIKNTPFYSVILDTTQDLSKVNQLSQVFQYVTIEKDEKGNPAKKHLESFNVILMIVFQTKVLETINVVSKMLQSETQELGKAAEMLENAYNLMKDLRNSFSNIRQLAVKVAQTWGAPKAKHHFDELSADQQLTDQESWFKVNVFYTSIDIIIAQLDHCFRSLKDIVHDFHSVNPQFLVESSDENLHVAERYAADLSPNFAAQLSFRSCLKSKIKKLSTAKELATMLIVEKNALLSSFSDVCTACMLFLTIPVTVSIAECSFLKLKLIKNYLHTTVLSVENEHARKVDIFKTIDIFANKKARKQQF
uniref:DUF4371 domain-containing protein n=1 Tax=Latimeria chalumnae TaxID=7897 RepID=H3A840_LATCH